MKTSSKKPNRPPAWRGPMTSIVDGDLVYIRNPDGREELYNVASDPEEKHDLATTGRGEAHLGRFRDILARLKGGRAAEEVPMVASEDRDAVRR